MIGEAIDKVISVVSPAWALNRAQARNAFRGYEAGRKDRLTKPRLATSEPGDSPDLSKIQQTRYNAWDLWRNNHHARKIVRNITSQVIGGVGMWPEPQITRNGRADHELRIRLIDNFRRFASAPHVSGSPGRGGCSWPQLQKQILREVILSGECLIRLRLIKGRSVPLAIEIIEADRLAEDQTQITKQENGNVVFRGIEFNPRTGERVAYHIYDYHPQHVLAGFNWSQLKPKPVPAEQILHVYSADRANQMRGVSWFAPVLRRLGNIDDYEFDELLGASIAACFAVAVTMHPGAGSIGLNTPSTDSSTDADSNNITRIQPGQLVRLRPGESVTPINPARNGGQTEQFVNHLLRGAATGMPGVKASTLTGDYRNSSFSSEKAADNDCWRETDDLQEWFASTFCQPVWNKFVDVMYLNNVFDGRFSETRIEEMRNVTWSGPVPKSINPSDDAKASGERVRVGTSSLQDESSSQGKNWRDNLIRAAEVIDECKALGLPEWYVANLFTAKVAPEPEPEEQKDGKDEPQKNGKAA